MRLPVPNTEEVEKFKQVYRRTCGVELSDAEALDAALLLIRLVYLVGYALPNMRAMGDAADRGAPERQAPPERKRHRRAIR